jgi:hypothetical protein
MKKRLLILLISGLFLFTGKSGDSAQLISPGELSKAHKKLEGIAQCFKCHTLTKGITDAACRECHEKLNERIIENKGFHAGLKAECIQCHKEHKGKDYDITSLDKETFDHKMTGYELQDRHKKQCDKCHEKENTYLGLSPECLNCHADVHKKTLPEDCIRCHNFTGWENVRFDHLKDSEFILTGKHSDLKCEGCHPGYEFEDKEGGTVYQVLKFKPLTHGKCNDCHNDIHRGEFKEKACRNCHTTKGWKETVFDHNDPLVSAFRLQGRHENAACGLCHPKEKRTYRQGGKSIEKLIVRTKPVKHGLCRDCHYDVHKGQFEKHQCDNCHSQNDTWKNHIFNHDSKYYRGYKLRGRHRGVDCGKCHERSEIRYTEFRTEKRAVVGRFKPCKADVCSDCHYDVHKGGFENQTCDGCHTPENEWRNSLFNHESEKYAGYKPTGRHKEVECAKCHERSEIIYTEFESKKKAFVGRFRPIKSDSCRDCHYDVHNDVYRGMFEEQKCSECHSQDRTWKEYTFNHASNKYRGYKPKGRHEEAECGKCHERSEIIYTEFNSKKKASVGKFKPVKSGSCRDCHYDVHEGQFEKQQCDACHSQEQAWKEYTFDHKSAKYSGFKLEGKHRRVECWKCHERSEISYREFNSRKKVSIGKFRLSASEGCKDCHSDDHKGQFKVISKAKEVTCDSCHSVEKEWAEFRYKHKTDGKYNRYNPGGRIDESKCEACHMCESDVFCVSCCIKGMGILGR